MGKITTSSSCLKSEQKEKIKSGYAIPDRENHLISGSNDANSGESKNSISVISKPSHIFLIVRIFGSLLLPYRMFFTEEGGKADKVASLLIVMLRSAHKRKILSLIAPTVFMLSPTLFSKHIKFHLKK